MKEDVIILCSGNNNFFSLEDSVCAGMLISELIDREIKRVELTDASMSAMTLFKSFGKNIFKMLSETDHGKLLIENGFKDDLKACAELDEHRSYSFLFW